MVNKNKGRKSAYCFFIISRREFYIAQNPGVQFVFGDFMRESSVFWKALDDPGKEPYHRLAAADKLRHDAAAASALSTQLSRLAVTKTKKRKRSKDPDAPKRPLSAFLMFCAATRSVVKQENQQIRVGDMAKVLGRRWAECTDRSEYERQHEVNVARYEQEMAEYKDSGREGEWDSHSGEKLIRKKLLTVSLDSPKHSPAALEESSVGTGGQLEKEEEENIDKEDIPRG